MLRIHGLNPEQMGALLRLMADNQSFEDLPDREGTVRQAAAGLVHTADPHGSPTSPRRAIAQHLRLVSG